MEQEMILLGILCLKREIYSMPLISLISLGYFHTNHFSDVSQLLFNGREKKIEHYHRSNIK